MPLPADSAATIPARSSSATARCSAARRRGVMRLTAAGAAALAELRAGPVRSAAAGLLARRLTDAGLAHPVPPADGRAPAAADSVTVHHPGPGSRPQACWTAASWPPRRPSTRSSWSTTARPIRRRSRPIAARHGAAVRRREASGGPAAARNTGLAGIQTDLIALPGQRLRAAARLDQPAGRAPGRPAGRRRRAADRRARRAGTVGRPGTRQARGSLDLGAPGGAGRPGRPGLLRADRRAARAPRRAATVPLSDAAAASSIRALRYGEDVDLVWRLHDAGWRIRYEPAGPGAARQTGELAGPARPPVPVRHVGRAARPPPPGEHGAARAAALARR